MQRTVVIAGCLWWASWSAQSAPASQLLGVAFDQPTALYSINQSTGALAAVGLTGFTNVADLTSDPLTHTLWGVDVNGNQLLEMDPKTGGALKATALDSADPIGSIAFDPLTRVLYGNSVVGFGKTSQDALYRIDPLTGHTTLIGALGSFEQVFALGFDQHGVLFGISDHSRELITIDTATGLGSLIPGAPQLPFEGNFDLASRPEDNAVFVANSLNAQLYLLDTSNAALTPVGPYGSVTNIVGLAFLSSVPEPSTYAAFAGGLLALFALRRRLR
jgi:hypothetical protein